MSHGQLLQDDDGKPVLGLQDDATGLVIPLHVGAKVTGADGKSYAKLDLTLATAASPQITEEQIRAYIDAGQGFTAFINGSITAAQAAAISLFANAIAKKVVIFRVTAGEATAGSNCKLAKQATDFALGAGAAVANNLNTGSAITSLVTLSSSITATASGTVFDYTLLPAYIPNEILENNEVVIIPAGTTEAVAAFCDCVGTAGQGFVSISWLEI